MKEKNKFWGVIAGLFLILFDVIKNPLKNFALISKEPVLIFIALTALLMSIISFSHGLYVVMIVVGTVISFIFFLMSIDTGEPYRTRISIIVLLVLLINIGLSVYINEEENLTYTYEPYKKAKIYDNH